MQSFMHFLGDQASTKIQNGLPTLCFDTKPIAMKSRKPLQTDCQHLADVAEQIIALFSEAGTELDSKEIRIAVVAILQEFALNQSGAELSTYRDKLTPPQLAKMWGVGPDKVLAWIRNGVLQATNVAASRGG